MSIGENIPFTISHALIPQRVLSCNLTSRTGDVGLVIKKTKVAGVVGSSLLFDGPSYSGFGTIRLHRLNETSGVIVQPVFPDYPKFPNAGEICGLTVHTHVLSIALRQNPATDHTGDYKAELSWVVGAP